MEKNENQSNVVERRREEGREGGAERQERNQRYCLVCISQLCYGKQKADGEKGTETEREKRHKTQKVCASLFVYVCGYPTFFFSFPSIGLSSGTCLLGHDDSWSLSFLTSCVFSFLFSFFVFFFK